MTLLEGAGCVEQVETHREVWRLTDTGFRKLQVTHTLSLVGPALACREGIALQDASVFELLTMLQAKQWACSVFIRTKGCRSFLGDSVSKSVQSFNNNNKNNTQQQHTTTTIKITIHTTTTTQNNEQQPYYMRVVAIPLPVLC
jgi:hypothetical protein